METNFQWRRFDSKQQHLVLRNTNNSFTFEPFQSQCNGPRLWHGRYLTLMAMEKEALPVVIILASSHSMAGLIVFPGVDCF